MVILKTISAIENEFRGVLGIAFRGRRLVLGYENITHLPPNKIKGLIVTEDLSEKPKRHLEKIADEQGISLIVFPSLTDLGHAFGVKRVGALAITYQGLANKIEKLLKEGDQYGR